MASKLEDMKDSSVSPRPTVAQGMPSKETDMMGQRNEKGGSAQGVQYITPISVRVIKLGKGKATIEHTNKRTKSFHDGRT